MGKYRQSGRLQIDTGFFAFVNAEVLPDLSLRQEDFWPQFDHIVHELAPKNQALLKKRDALQQQIDDWHKEHDFEATAYKQFLLDIAYLLPEGEDFTISTENVDEEIAVQAGPQLVVPAKNARFALNAANARWGSLYDALYGSDVIADAGGAKAGAEYNPVRGAKVIAYARQLLDAIAPLVSGSHADAAAYAVANEQLVLTLLDGAKTTLLEPEKFAGFNGAARTPASVLLVNNGLHVEIQIDSNSVIGKNDPAGIKDLLMESALTTIMDCEDSVAAVDAEDKIEVYRNLLGLLQGRLQASFEKAGRVMTRKLNPDRDYLSPAAKPFKLPGRSLLFIRNVGHLMTSSVALDKDGNEIPEGILDGVMTALLGLHDLRGPTELGNSRVGSIYIVKPKMHGPEEVAFSCELFMRIEQALCLPPNTLKIGIMDEERRTTLNLKECIRMAKERVVFINTGFLDRTGDEIHTSMLAGPFMRKVVCRARRRSARACGPCQMRWRR